MPPDRWVRLGIELHPWRKPTKDGYVLLCAQVPWDTQVQDGNHLAWIEETVREIKKHTDRSIVFRGHPKAWRRNNPYALMTNGHLHRCIIFYLVVIGAICDSAGV